MKKGNNIDDNKMRGISFKQIREIELFQRQDTILTFANPYFDKESDILSILLSKCEIDFKNKVMYLEFIEDNNLTATTFIATQLESTSIILNDRLEFSDLSIEMGSYVNLDIAGDSNDALTLEASIKYNYVNPSLRGS